MTSREMRPLLPPSAEVRAGVRRLIEKIQFHEAPFDTIKYSSLIDIGRDGAKKIGLNFTSNIQEAFVLKAQSMAFHRYFDNNKADEVLKSTKIFETKPPVIIKEVREYIERPEKLKPKELRKSFKEVIKNNISELRCEKGLKKEASIIASVHDWFRFKQYPMLALGADFPPMYSGAVYTVFVDLEKDISVDISSLLGVGTIIDVISEEDVKNKLLEAWPVISLFAQELYENVCRIQENKSE